MIYEITRQIATELRAKGMPYPVIYGPERRPRTMIDARIVIERNRDASDSFEAPRSRNVNPRMIGVRWVACVAHIFARSNLAGAGNHDHEREADLMVDPFTVALHKVVRARNNLYRIAECKLMSATELELEGLEQWPGAVYRVAFAVDRAVNDVTWQGAAQPEATLGGEGGVTIGTTLNVSGSGGGSALPSASTEHPE